MDTSQPRKIIQRQKQTTYAPQFTQGGSPQSPPSTDYITLLNSYTTDTAHLSADYITLLERSEKTSPLCETCLSAALHHAK